VGYRKLNPPVTMPQEVPLPLELQPRAELLARAWLTRDVPLMRRLTATTHERGVYAWSRRHPPPVVLDRDRAEEVLKQAVEVVELQNATGTATLLVRINGLVPGKAVELPQQWVERGGSWYFIPPER
jgi:hypothetical protein